jgi:beta-galactosidase
MRETIHLNFGWLFASYQENHLTNINPIDFNQVDLPHHAVLIPKNNFDEEMLEVVSSYVKYIDIKESLQGSLLRIRFEGVAHHAKLYVNKQYVREHFGGYTPFEADISSSVIYGQTNEILVVVDSRENASIPPFGGVVDYLGYSGIYREVSLIITKQAYIKDITIRTGGSKIIALDIEMSEPKGILIFKIKNQEKEIVAKGMYIINHEFVKTELMIENHELWDINHPYLYTLETHYEIESKLIDSLSIRFGIRHAEFKKDGFYLNHQKIKLMGLNRHQSYPYVGYAMPKSAQIEDADILKYSLGLNVVRTSHYPQSKHFLNRCDEIGLLVFEEIPGWQHIGDEKWQLLSLEYVKQMILRDKNHPSIILWGVRINESPDHHQFYQKTNELARSLDPTRQTGGVRNIQKSEFLEDVYTYNDFSHTGNNSGLDPKKKVCKDVPYLVTEYNGHMFPTKRYDSEAHRLSHTLRHINVINNMLDPDNGISGAIGWCMSDYNTHQEFGSGDKVCYHGVLDMFRIPKMASYAYSTQQDLIPILEVSSHMNIGEHPGGSLPPVLVFTNLDYLKFYKNEQLIGSYYPNQKKYKHLKHPPIEITDFIGETLQKNEKMSFKDAEKTKKIIRYVTTHGNNLPFKYKLTMLFLLKKYKMSFDDGVKMFFRYTSGWGSEKMSYRFEGYRGDKLEKTVIKENNNQFSYEVKPSKKYLKIEETYDVIRYEIRKVNQNKELVTYAFDALNLKVSKEIELIGPTLLNLEGGATAFWVKSREQGKGEISIQIGEETILLEVLVK